MTERLRAPSAPLDIAIVGGGLIGPALALGLHAQGFTVAVLDRQAEALRAAPDFDGRAYAIAPASARLLEALGLWQGIAPLAQPIARITVGEGAGERAGAPPLLRFDPALIGAERLGWIVEDHILRAALLEAMARAGIAHLAPAEVSAADYGPGHACLALADGRRIEARLAVAADGRRSALATAAGIGRIGWRYEQTGLVSAISHERPHEGTAHQSFFPGGPFAVLPMTGARSALVWSERTARARALMALDETAYLTQVAHRLGPRLGAIAPLGRRWAYPLDLTLAHRYCAPRLALAGDAAHGVHPIAGQGLNLGLRDVAALIEVLVEAARRGEDIGAVPVLERYQRWRRFDAAAFALGTDGLNRLFSNDSGLLGAIRRAGMAAVGAAPPLMRTILLEATGGAGTVPRLLRGEPV